MHPHLTDESSRHERVIDQDRIAFNCRIEGETGVDQRLRLYLRPDDGNMDTADAEFVEHLACDIDHPIHMTVAACGPAIADHQRTVSHPGRRHEATIISLHRRAIEIVVSRAEIEWSNIRRSGIADDRIDPFGQGELHRIVREPQSKQGTGGDYAIKWI